MVRRPLRPATRRLERARATWSAVRKASRRLGRLLSGVLRAFLLRLRGALGKVDSFFGGSGRSELGCPRAILSGRTRVLKGYLGKVKELIRCAFENCRTRGFWVKERGRLACEGEMGK